MENRSSQGMRRVIDVIVTATTVGIVIEGVVVDIVDGNGAIAVSYTHLYSYA